MRNTLPSGWSWLALSQVVGPPQYGLSLPADPRGNMPMIGMKDIVEGRIVDALRTQVRVDIEQKNSFKLNTGDLLLNRTNSPALVGKLAIWDRTEDAVFASYLVRYPAILDIAVPKFTVSALSSRRSAQQIERLITPGVSQANINPASFHDEVEIALPPLSEQRRIVALLDVWDRAMDALERLIIAHRNRKTALVQKLFQNLPQRSILEAATIWFSGVDKKSLKGESPVLLCNYMDVFNHSEITSNLAFMSATATQRQIATNRLRKHDVVFTKDSETFADIAECALVLEDIDNLVCGYHLAVARPNAAVCSGPFLAHALRHPKIRWQFSRLANGVVRYGLTLNALEQIEIPLPSLRVQRDTAEILTAEDRTITDLSSRLKALNLQKHGLMQKLLTGEWQVADIFDVTIDERSRLMATEET